MKGWINFALLVVVMFVRLVHGEVTPAPEDAERFLDEVRRAYAEEDYTQLDTLFRRPAWDLTKTLSEEQWNGLAHLLADHLEYGELPAAYRPGESWAEFLRANYRDRAMVRRNGINALSVQRLHGMAVAGQLSDPELIPMVIDALDHPSTNVRRRAYYTLATLTKRHFGDEVWSRGIADADKEPRHIREWREWWILNRDKRPILSKDLQDQVINRVVALVDQIRKELGPEFPGELDWISEEPGVQNRFSLDYNPLVQYRYEPILLSGLFPPPKANESPPRALPFLFIEVTFATTPESDRKRESSADSKLSDLRPLPVRSMYEEAVEGTDLRIQVLLSSPNEDLADAIAELLRDR